MLALVEGNPWKFIRATIAPNITIAVGPKTATVVRTNGCKLSVKLFFVITGEFTLAGMVFIIRLAMTTAPKTAGIISPIGGPVMG
jgi:hypothetical protein